VITAVVVDNGDGILPTCLESLRAQVDEILLCPGPKSQMEKIQSLPVDRVIRPVEGIGNARVRGIVASRGNQILSCDSDTVYEDGYAAAAEKALESWDAVMAGRIRPLDKTRIGSLGWIESSLAWAIPYEFALGFRRDAFLKRGLHRADYSHPRADIGPQVGWNLFPIPIPTMSCRTRMPTFYAKRINRMIRDYTPGALAAALPFFVIGSGILLQRLRLRPRRPRSLVDADA